MTLCLYHMALEFWAHGVYISKGVCNLYVVLLHLLLSVLTYDTAMYYKDLVTLPNETPNLLYESEVL